MAMQEEMDFPTSLEQPLTQTEAPEEDKQQDVCTFLFLLLQF